jgi:hypothetical protein
MNNMYKNNGSGYIEREGELLILKPYRQSDYCLVRTDKIWGADFTVGRYKTLYGARVALNYFRQQYK